MRKYAHTSIFSQFPTELVDEIARYSAVCELKTLCLVSKQTGDVATRRLYHTIVLEDLKNAVRCFKTLATRQDVAGCVRRIGMYVLFFFFCVAMPMAESLSSSSSLSLSLLTKFIPAFLSVSTRAPPGPNSCLTGIFTRFFWRHCKILTRIYVMDA